VGSVQASAAVTGGPTFTPPPFARGTLAQPDVASVTLTWAPATFSDANSLNRIEVRGTDPAGGFPFLETLPGSATSVNVFATNGRAYDVEITACVAGPPGCFLVPPAQKASSTGVVRVDATPPAGTVLIEGGAPAINRRQVTVDLAASDPLASGAPGSSSGITQYALDQDGNGTFPCPSLFDPGPDDSGCAAPFSATVPATLTPGEGMKSVGVMFGDGARFFPCVPSGGVFCIIDTGRPILGNASQVATDSINLDLTKPIALATQDRFTVERGGTVSFDSAGSVDVNPAIASGVDPAGATWDFKDGTPAASGQKVTHTFAQVGTFVGELLVRDRAGNQSDPRPFTVTVNPRPGETAAGGGTVGAVTAGQGAAAFRIDRVKVSARYERSRLKGSIAITGSASAAGPLLVEIRPAKRGKLRRLATTVPVGPFAKSLALPADLLPGTYRLVFAGPGGSLNSSLELIPPREGVLRSGAVRASRRAALATFNLAALPARALRGRLTVAWSQGPRGLGLVKVRSGTRIGAGLPTGAAIGSGPLRAVLRAGAIVVGGASVRPR
jgi:PKD domain